MKFDSEGNLILPQSVMREKSDEDNGIILTKADTDEKGGTSLSVGHVTRKPILYLGIGQKYNDIIPFDKRKFTKELGL